MEDLINYVNKFPINEELLARSGIVLLNINDINLIKSNQDDFRLTIKINIEYAVFYDKIYTGMYKDVKIELREMFMVLSFLKAYLIIKSANVQVEELLDAIRILDTGIMIGNGCDLMTDFTQKLHDFVVSIKKVPQLTLISDLEQSSLNFCDIPIVKQPSVEHFWTNYFYLHRPVKLTSCIDHWPALRKWKDFNYLLKIAAYRTVPIELGRTYDDDDWGQNLFKFGDFLRSFNQNLKVKAYLAQHDLFDQIPALKNDFVKPEFCTQEPIVKAWIGPFGTISKMHTDEKHNLLCQVFGEKLIILASPDETNNLYPHIGLLNNTTQIEAENLDFEKFPLTKNVKFYKIVLKAGEMLFIPKLWWHYVRSLTTSISVSFWFDED